MASIREWINLVENRVTKPFSDFTEAEVTAAIQQLIPVYTREVCYHSGLYISLEAAKVFESIFVPAMMKHARYLAQAMMLSYKNEPKSFRHTDYFGEIEILQDAVDKILRISGIYEKMLAEYPDDVDELFTSLDSDIMTRLLHRVYLDLTTKTRRA